MKRSKWWVVAVAGGALALTMMVLVLDRPSPVQLAGVLAVNAAFVVCWLALGRQVTRANARSTMFVILAIALCGIGAAISPSMTTIQAIASPLIWINTANARRAIGANVVLAIAIGSGYVSSTGPDWTSVQQAVIIECVSLGASIALGLWISNTTQQRDDRQELVEQLQATQRQLSDLSRSAGVTSERERLAREIHDTVAQDLTALVMLAEGARMHLAAGQTQAAAARLELLEESARAALAETRALVTASAPVRLTGEGIACALERLGARFERETGVLVTVSADAAAPLDRDTEVVLLRCAQEALANVRKHAGAGTVAIALRLADDAVTLSIADDGGGFDPALPSDGFGLAGLRDRLALVDGDLRLETSPGRGTTVTATMALARVSA